MRTYLLLGLWLAGTAAALAQEVPPLAPPVKEGNIERWVIDDGLDRDAAAWAPAEGVVAVDTKRAKRGTTSLRFHVDVNWETGEAKYPVGWPRMNRKVPPEAQDWSSWDYLEFSIYVESSRKSLPTVPMGLGIYSGGGKADYNRSLTELQLGKWTDYRLPLSALPSLKTRTGMQFHIAEANYRHGDVLDFWIDNISLVRYVAPTLTASRLAESVIFSDARYVLVDLDVMGVKPGTTADVTWALSSRGKTVSEGLLQVGRGLNTVGLPLPQKPLAAGDYELAVRTQGDSPPPFALRVVSSPWQEGSK